MTNPLHPFYTSKSARRQFDTENAAWLKPVREAFHAYMFAHEGYTNLQQPGPGLEYTGSHAQGLWECWLAATLASQSKWIDIATPPPMVARPGMWPVSENVLVLHREEIEIAHMEQIDEDCPVRWTDAGSEGWILTGITHWMPLPAAPPSPGTPQNPADHLQGP